MYLARGTRKRMTTPIAIHLFSQRFGQSVRSPFSLSLSLSLFCVRTEINFVNVNFSVQYDSAGFELSRTFALA